MAASSAFFVRTGSGISGPSRLSAETEALALERTTSGSAGGSEPGSRGASSFTGAGRPFGGRGGGGGGGFPTASADYALHGKLGEGVTATVYLATCKPLRRTVAVKLLDLEAIEAAGGLDVVIKETAVMAGMRHPNVLPLLASFVEGGSMWMVLPYYASGSLLSIVQYRHPDGLTDWAALATVMREVARGLAYMHASGRIHRDLKAANILVGPDGKVALADFGVSAALEASPEEEPASQSQHQPGAEPPKAYDAGAMLRRVSMQQQQAAGGQAGATSGRGEAPGGGGGGGGGEGSGRSSKGMTAAEYRAARRAGQFSPASAPSLLTQSLGGRQTVAGSEEGGAGGSPLGGVSRRVFSNASYARQYLSRTTFVGTPCWMAPEVMAPQQGVGYGQAADIWSFGITLLEVATGRAPTARRSVNEILISVLSSPEDDPSSIAGELSHTPEAFQEVVYSCLAKNPAERPTAQQLLQMRFFKTAAAPQSLARNLLAGVPLVTDRDEAASPYESKAARAESETGDISGSRRLTRINSSVSASRNGGGGNGGVDGVSVREFLQTAVQLLQQLGRGELPADHQKFRFSPNDLCQARGFGFCIVKRGKYLRAPARGRGFVIAKLAEDEGVPTTWSAPSWYTSRSNASGFTTGNDEVSCIFTVREQSDLDDFCSDVKTSCRADVGHKNRHLRCCRSLCTATLTQLSLSKGGVVHTDREANELLYGEGAEAAMIVGGRVRPPPEFNALYGELRALLEGEPLKDSRSRLLDTPQGARNVQAALSERISRSAFSPAAAAAAGRPRRSTEVAGERGAAPQPGAIQRLRSYQHYISSPQVLDSDATVGRTHQRSASFQSANVGPMVVTVEGSVDSQEGSAAAPLPERPLLRRDSCHSSAPDLARASLQSGTQTDATPTDTGSPEDSSNSLAAMESAEADAAAGAPQPAIAAPPSPLRLSSEGRSAAGGGGGSGGALRIAPSAEERITVPVLHRRNLERHSPGPREDSALNLAWSPTAGAALPGSSPLLADRLRNRPKAPDAFGGGAEGAAQKGGVSQLPGALPPVTPGHGSDGSLLTGEGFARPPALAGIATGSGEEWSPPPPSPGGIWGGGARTPAGLEPVMEDATLVGALPSQPSSSGRGGSGDAGDASIFDIGALPSHEADRGHAAAVAALEDGESSETATPTAWRPNDSGGMPRTPGGGDALRVPSNLTSASTNPRSQRGSQGGPQESAPAAPACARARNEFRWTFEDTCSFDAAACHSRLHTLKTAVTLSETDLGELMAVANKASGPSNDPNGVRSGSSGSGGRSSALARFGHFVYGSHLSKSASLNGRTHH